jgi:hypothetical protein
LKHTTHSIHAHDEVCIDKKEKKTTKAETMEIMKRMREVYTINKPIADFIYSELCQEGE